MDLMFSNPADPSDVIEARSRYAAINLRTYSGSKRKTAGLIVVFRRELAAIKRWIIEADERRRGMKLRLSIHPTMKSRKDLVH